MLNPLARVAPRGGSVFRCCGAFELRDMLLTAPYGWRVGCGFVEYRDGGAGGEGLRAGPTGRRAGLVCLAVAAAAAGKLRLGELVRLSGDFDRLAGPGAVL